MFAASNTPDPCQNPWGPKFSREVLDTIENVRRGDTESAEYNCKRLLQELQVSPVPGRNARYRLIERIKRVYGLSFECNLLPETLREPNLEQYRKPARPGVSVVTCSMNRTENLLRALPTWLAHDEVQEVIIVDWASDVPVTDYLRNAGMWDSRVKVIRVTEQPRWILSYAFNLGFRFPSCERVLKADADIMLHEEFFRRNPLKNDQFIAGDWRQAQEGQEYINGFFYTWREALNDVNGFNEFITTYGWDDTDLYARLSDAGIDRKCVDVTTVWHQDHGDEDRLHDWSPPTESALSILRANALRNIRRNRYIAEVMPDWGPSSHRLQYKVESSESNYAQVTQSGDPISIVDDATYEHATEYATRELASWSYGEQVWETSYEVLVKVLGENSYNALTRENFGDAVRSAAEQYAPYIATPKRKLYVDAQHGLGNRLRAVGSAASIAKHLDHELVIVWQPDVHCDCRFSDLFDYKGPVVDESFLGHAERCVTHNYMVAEGGEKDTVIRPNVGCDIYVRSAFVLNSPHPGWRRDNRFIQSLTPVAPVEELVQSVRNPNDLSVHVRMEGGKKDEHLPYESGQNWTEEDHALIDYWRSKSHFSQFIKRIDSLVADGAVESIFIAADKSDVYDVFLERYADRIAFLPRVHYDRSIHQLRYALADATLLSRAPRLLGSTWSSFSELARRLAPSPLTVEMSGVDF